jgi:hypothetical protein
MSAKEFPMAGRFLLVSMIVLAAASVLFVAGASAAAPVLLRPAEDAVLRHARPVLDWRDVSSAAQYQAQVSRRQTFRAATLVVDVSTTSSRHVPVTDLPGGTVLYWRVRARVGAFYTPWSEVWRFTTGNPPSIPVLLSPADGAQLGDPSPLFDWQDSSLPPGVTFGRYQIQIAADRAFVRLLHNQNIAGVANSQDESASLAACASCYWRVRAFSASGDYSAWSAARSFSVSFITDGVIDPRSLEYLGAFRLPSGGNRPRTFEYGGNAMTVNPLGDPGGAADGFPGSLFISGHDRMPYSELPNGSQVAEVGIPAPIISADVDSLTRADFIQNFCNVTAGHFTRMDEIVRMGLLYLDHPLTGPKIHIAWGQHFEPDPPAPTHGWFSPTLATPNFKGEWYLKDQSFYSVNDYLLEIPSNWAEANVQGRVIGAGRFKDGGWSGMGPALIAYRPWTDSGTPPSNGARLDATPLLLYENSLNTDIIERALAGYQHPDDWNGGAWLVDASGKSALLFAGTKSNGTKYWYGYVNPAGPQYPCVDAEVTDFLTCRMADGSSCPPADFRECAGHNSYRGWWTTRWEAQFLFYDPSDLARVAAGELASWEPQPYAVLDIDERLFLNPSGVETDMLGTGVQRRYRLGDVAYDRVHNLIYVLELFADGAAPVVHVWRVP